MVNWHPQEELIGTHWKVYIHMDVSENSGTPKSSILTRVFLYKPSILGYPYFWKHPYNVLYPFRNNVFVFLFHPYLRKIPILTNIFQRGWSHQLDMISCTLSLQCSLWEFQSSSFNPPKKVDLKLPTQNVPGMLGSKVRGYYSKIYIYTYIYIYIRAICR